VRLAGEPNEEPLKGIQGAVEGGLAEAILGSQADLFRQVGLETLGPSRPKSVRTPGR
jgi:hypothetical protein